MFRDTTRRFATGTRGLDSFDRFDEVHGVVVVLLHARGNGENVRVEDDIVRIEFNDVDQQIVATFADRPFPVDLGGLTTNRGVL